MGKGVKGPLENLKKRFGKDKNTYLEKRLNATNRTYKTKQGTMKKYPSEVYTLTRYLEIMTNKNIGKVCIVGDIMQVIEGKRYKRERWGGEQEVRTAHELYLSMKAFIVMALQVEGCDTVVLTPDACVNENAAKDMAYFSIGGKRRIGVKPMVLCKEDKGKIIVKDDFAPSGKDWTSFKRNPLLRQQLNWYLGHKLMSDKVLSQIVPLTGSKRVIFDNFIKIEDVHTKDTDSINYYSIVLDYIDGNLVEPDYEDGSNIAEGEMAIEYYVSKLSLDEEYKNHRFIAYTSDQDIIPITQLNASRREREGIKHPKSYYIAMKTRNTKKKTFFKFFDALQLHENIKKFHNYRPLAVEMEMFFFLLGGCDYSKKPLKGVGWEKALYPEYISNPKKYLKMFTFSHIPIKEDENEKIICDLVCVNPKIYRKYVYNVFKRKYSKKTYEKKFRDLDKKKIQVIPRQIMYNFLWTLNIVQIRIQEGVSLQFDPLETDEEGTSLWGYKKGKVKNSFSDWVVVSSDSVSMKRFKL